MVNFNLSVEGSLEDKRIGESIHGALRYLENNPDSGGRWMLVGGAALLLGRQVGDGYHPILEQLLLNPGDPELVTALIEAYTQYKANLEETFNE